MVSCGASVDVRVNSLKVCAGPGSFYDGEERIIRGSSFVETGVVMDYANAVVVSKK